MPLLAGLLKLLKQMRPVEEINKMTGCQFFKKNKHISSYSEKKVQYTFLKINIFYAKTLLKMYDEETVPKGIYNICLCKNSK